MKRDLKPLNVFSVIPRYKALQKKRAKPRRGPLRDPKYRRWISEHLSVLNEFAEPGYRPFAPRLGPVNDLILSDPAHTENNGISSKGPDSSCVPLTRKEHLEYDANREAFERKYGVNMRELAKQYWERYNREKAA